MTDLEKAEILRGLRDYVESITDRSRKERKRYVCPLCHNPRSFSILPDGEHWHCFDGECNKGGTIFTLIQELENITEYPKLIERAAEITGVRLSDSKPKTATEKAALSEKILENKNKRQAGDVIEDWQRDTLNILCTYYRLAVFDWKGLLKDSEAHRPSAEKRLKEVKGYIDTMINAESFSDIDMLYKSRMFHEQLQDFAKYIDFREGINSDDN